MGHYSGDKDSRQDSHETVHLMGKIYCILGFIYPGSSPKTSQWVLKRERSVSFPRPETTGVQSMTTMLVLSTLQEGSSGDEQKEGDKRLLLLRWSCCPPPLIECRSGSIMLSVWCFRALFSFPSFPCNDYFPSFSSIILGKQSYKNLCHFWFSC